MLSGVFQAASIASGDEPSRAGAVELILAAAVAGVVGYAAIALLLRCLAHHSTLVFVIYRVALGVLVLGLSLSGLIE